MGDLFKVMLIKNSNIKSLIDFKIDKIEKLSYFPKIKHGFFNKKGGISKGIYKSLNW